MPDTAQAATPTLFGRGTAIFKEHEDLRPMVARLRTHASELALDREPTESAFGALLNGFFDQLLLHFAAEEDPGYFGTFVADCPELTADVDRLMTDHEAMVDAIERLRALPSQRSAREIALGLLALLEVFEEHERRESQLVRSFLSAPPAIGS
jgi:hypothetical protein